MKAKKKKRGMTLVEVLVSASIFAFCLAGLLLTFMDLFILTDVSRDSTLAAESMRTQLERLHTASFENVTLFNNTSFDVIDPNVLINGTPLVIGRGHIEINTVTNPFSGETYADLRMARVVVSFRSRNRIVGEDQNLNGAWDEGEDQSGYVNGTGVLNSPVEAVILIKNFTNSSE
ncbi:MAG: type II secretion system protein [Candidatus Omnitrophica bacterium]|nr:type II secretion system protein [Candidatus Omnitrophota bacterium]